MTMREQLLKIPELNISKSFRQTDDSDFHEYVQALNSFIEKFPSQEESAKKALEAKDYPSLSKKLAAIHDMLLEIRAVALADVCMKQINVLSNTKHEKIEAFLTYFLSVLTMLSIDIQMAIYKDENGGESKQPAKTTDEAGIENKSILAVDDSAFILGILKNILSGTKYKVTCVTSGGDALKFLESKRPDLFILDIEMPKINGYELVEKIRESGHTAPVIFLTGNATKEYVIKAVKSGVVDFITKPVDKDQVLARIAKYI